MNSDGHIVLSSGRPHRTLVVLNQYEELPPELGSIQGRKYYDVNGNGDFDQEEKDAPGNPNRLNDWTINLYTNLSEDPIANLITGHTGNKGQYRFEDLLPGTYYVCEVLQNGWIQTEPGGGGCHEVQVGPGEDVKGIQFGNKQT